MPDTPGGRTRYSVQFDELAYAEDLRHASPAGREVARSARARLDRDGASLDELWRCDPEHREGTRLPNCVKTYLPGPGGRWRMIFEAVYDADAHELRLAYLAFGVGHPEHAWQRSAYEVADRRLHHAG
jgi:hypothetical protein